MEIDTFSPENIDLRALKVAEAFDGIANAHYEKLESMSESLPADYFENDKIEWFDVKTPVLGGKTPEEYIKEIWGEKPDFEASIEIVKAFMADDNYSVPSEIRDIVLVHKKQLISWSKNFIDACAKQEDYEITTEAICSLIYMLAELDDDEIAESMLAFYDTLEDEEKNEAVSEAVGMYLASTEKGVGRIIEKINAVSEPTAKEFGLLTQAAVSDFKSDELYRAIRSFCKKAKGELVPAVYYIFQDYGDPRAVSYLRGLAKQYEPAAMGMTEDAKKNKQIFFSLLEIIEALGGNTEDLLG